MRLRNVARISLKSLSQEPETFLPALYRYVEQAPLERYRRNDATRNVSGASQEFPQLVAN